MDTENSECEEAGTGQAGPLVKSQLAQAVAQALDISLNDAANIVELIFASIVSAIKCGDRVEIRGLGVFAGRQRQGRTGRNPKTGATVLVPAKRVAYFATSQRLQGELNRG